MATPDVTFERAFPTVFAECLKDLVDDVALDRILERLCFGVSAQLASLEMMLLRRRDDDARRGGGAGVPATAIRAVREVAGPLGAGWGDLVVTGPASTELDPSVLDAVAVFVTWLVDRHDARRRRVHAIDRERQLIAGELHDDSIQAMTAISLSLQRLVRTSDVDREQVEHLLHLTNDAIDRLRHMMFSLHPPSLADDGLVVTLEDYLDGFIAPTGLHVAVSGDPGRRSTAATEALAFRLSRGAVHNSWKHAEATSIDVAVDIDETEVVVNVRDDGVGFDPASIDHSDVGHAGIGYSRDLAAEVGGRYVVSSAPGAGTTVTIVLPTL